MEAGAPSSSVPLFSESQVADLVRRGMIDVGVVFRPYTEDLGDAAMKKSLSSAQTNALALANTNVPRTDFASVQILADTYDQVASQVTAALVQKASSTVLQPASLSSIPSSLQNSMDGQVVTASTNVRTDISAASIAPKTPPLEIVDVLGGSKTNPAVAMYAAGIAVMFLLFSMTAAGGSLLDEKENGTFERLMTSHLTIDELLMGKWLYMVFLGTLQMTLMFVWGQLVFSVELWRHFDALSL